MRVRLTVTCSGALSYKLLHQAHLPSRTWPKSANSSPFWALLCALELSEHLEQLTGWWQACMRILHHLDLPAALLHRYLLSLYPGALLGQASKHLLHLLDLCHACIVVLMMPARWLLLGLLHKEAYDMATWIAREQPCVCPTITLEVKPASMRPRPCTQAGQPLLTQCLRLGWRLPDCLSSCFEASRWTTVPAIQQKHKGPDGGALQ